MEFWSAAAICPRQRARALISFTCSTARECGCEVCSINATSEPQISVSFAAPSARSSPNHRRARRCFLARLRPTTPPSPCRAALKRWRRRRRPRDHAGAAPRSRNRRARAASASAYSLHPSSHSAASLLSLSSWMTAAPLRQIQSACDASSLSPSRHRHPPSQYLRPHRHALQQPQEPIPLPLPRAALSIQLLRATRGLPPVPLLTSSRMRRIAQWHRHRTRMSCPVALPSSRRPLPNAYGCSRKFARAGAAQ